VSGATRAAGVVPPPHRAVIRADRVYLGWQYAPLHADPGPLPRRPSPPPAERLNRGWVDAQRREERRLSLPATALAVASVGLWGLFLVLGLTGALNAWLTGLGLAASLAGAATAGRSVVRGERDLRERIAAEEQRVARIRDVQLGRLAARQERHAAAVRSWESRRDSFDRQLQWYAVSLPGDIDRVDVAGGTLDGWSALLTMIAAPRLSAGGDVTVLDLTEGAVARDLLAVARRSGLEPLVWVLPADLPRLELGACLPAAELAEVLAATVAASDEPGSGPGPGPAASASVDSAILDRVLAVLGGEPGIAQVTAALRALAQVGDPRQDVQAGLLTSSQLERLARLFGRGAADRVVIDRALAMESRLRKLDPLGSAPSRLEPSRLRVAWLDRRAGPGGNRVLGAYLTVALTHLLRQQPARRRWQHTLCVLGAERLHQESLDRLIDACETSGTGLVVCYRTISGPVRERLGRGNAAVAFMRLGNAQDARAASEQIGTEHRLVISQLTDTVGTSVTDTVGDSYSSTVGTADSVADSVSVSDTVGRSAGRGRSRQDLFAPFAQVTGSASRDTSHSHAASGSRSITAGISSGTSWGISTSRAAAMSSSAARTSQRSREFLVEQHQLQQLPPSAVIVTFAAPEGRQVVLADANPGIMTLKTATLLSLEEAIDAEAACSAYPPAAASQPTAASQQGAVGPGGALGPGGAVRPGGAVGRGGAVGPGGAAGRGGTAGQLGAASPGAAVPSSSDPPPNLGPPPERLDWRRRR
jgi:hypothetical protein